MLYSKKPVKNFPKVYSELKKLLDSFKDNYALKN